MENFIDEQNLAMFRRLLAEEPNMNQKRRKVILKFLAQEEMKDQAPLRKPFGDQTHRFLLNRES